MAKDAYYFSHDSNSRFDPKIVKLRVKFGLEGYGFYFCLLEIMRDSSSYGIANDEIETLSFQLNIEQSKTTAMLEFCLNVGLFYQDEGTIFSESFLERMESMNNLRAKRQEAGRKGGKAKAKLKQNDSIKGKEKKGKEKKIDIYNDPRIILFLKLFKEVTNKNNSCMFDSRKKIAAIIEYLEFEGKHLEDTLKVVFEKAKRDWVIEDKIRGNRNIPITLNWILKNDNFSLLMNMETKQTVREEF